MWNCREASHHSKPRYLLQPLCLFFVVLFCLGLVFPRAVNVADFRPLEMSMREIRSLSWTTNPLEFSKAHLFTVSKPCVTMYAYTHKQYAQARIHILSRRLKGVRFWAFITIYFASPQTGTNNTSMRIHKEALYVNSRDISFTHVPVIFPLLSILSVCFEHFLCQPFWFLCFMLFFFFPQNFFFFFDVFCCCFLWISAFFSGVSVSLACSFGPCVWFRQTHNERWRFITFPWTHFPIWHPLHQCLHGTNPSYLNLSPSLT